MAKKLRALSTYVNGPRNLAYTPGQEFDASDELFLFLMVDAPGSFEDVDTPKVKALDKPPVDKAVKKPEAKK
jgi:hypothetical protein